MNIFFFSININIEIDIYICTHRYAPTINTSFLYSLIKKQKHVCLSSSLLINALPDRLKYHFDPLE